MYAQLFESGSFHLSECIWNSSLLWPMQAVPLHYSNASLYEPQFLLFDGHSGSFQFWWLWIKVPQTFMYGFLCKQKFHFSGVHKHLGVGSLCYLLSVCLTLGSFQTVFQSGVPISHSSSSPTLSITRFYISAILIGV